MTTNRIFIKSMLAGCFAIALFSCNNAADTGTASADTTKVDTIKMDTMKPAPAMSGPAMTVPFDVVEVSQNIKDLASWKPKFDSGASLRKDAGLEPIVLSRVIGKPNSIQVVLTMTDMQKAKDFYASTQVKEMMQKGGMMGKPEIEYLHVIRFNPDSHEKQWVEVAHKVKDFDAWVKVYDGEGKDQRMAEGMVDVALARGIADSNMVHLIFDITDMAKAKSAIMSEAKKKLMMGAGVVGMPKIVYHEEIPQ